MPNRVALKDLEADPGLEAFLQGLLARKGKAGLVSAASFLADLESETRHGEKLVIVDGDGNVVGELVLN